MEEEKKKVKLIWKVLGVIGLILLSPVLIGLLAFGFLIYFIIFIIPAPVEFLFYKKSYFYKDFGLKYAFGVSHRRDYNLYNLIRKSNINAKFYTCGKNEWSYIETDKFILVFDWFEEIGFITQDKQWEIAQTDNDEPELLLDSLSKVVVKNISDCKKPVKILISKNLFKKEDYSRAIREDMFFIYDGKKDLLNKLSNLDSMNKIDFEVINAHKFSSNHKEELEKDERCGCFYCLQIFNPSEVKEWLNEGTGTALCPYCGIDSIIGESSGHPITKQFLKEMQKYWFSDF